MHDHDAQKKQEQKQKITIFLLITSPACNVHGSAPLSLTTCIYNIQWQFKIITDRYLTLARR